MEYSGLSATSFGTVTAVNPFVLVEPDFGRVSDAGLRVDFHYDFPLAAQDEDISTHL